MQRFLMRWQVVHTVTTDLKTIFTDMQVPSNEQRQHVSHLHTRSYCINGQFVTSNIFSTGFSPPHISFRMFFLVTFSPFRQMV